MQFETILSLGPTCRAKYQIIRIFGKQRSPSSVFDWQATPYRAVRFYLDNDFCDTFNREDLVTINGRVKHRKLHTSHLHAFPEGITDAEIDVYYPQARARHDHLCEKTRAVLHCREPVLICLGRHIKVTRWLRLAVAIRRYAPGLRFKLLAGPLGDLPDDDVCWQGRHDLWDRHLSPYSSATYKLARPGSFPRSAASMD